MRFASFKQILGSVIFSKKITINHGQIHTLSSISPLSTQPKKHWRITLENGFLFCPILISPKTLALKITITQVYIVKALIHHTRLPSVRPRQNIENITPAFFDKCPHDEPAEWRSLRLNNTVFTFLAIFENFISF